MIGFARWMRANPRGAVALAYLTLLLAVGVLAPWIAPYPPTAQNPMDMLLPPDAAHLLGTDDLGRDVFSRLIHSAPVALYASTLATLVALLIGVPVGLLAGFLGGLVDTVLGRLIDTMLSFPAIILAIAITGALGVGLTNGMLAIGVVFSPIVARLVRSQTLLVRSELYVDASRNFGAGTVWLLRRHILPNVMQPLVVQVTLLFAMSLLAEASLSFLGLGVQPPSPSWGAMLARAYSYLEIAPEQMYAPGFAILFTSLAFNALGEAIRVALDPTLRRR